MYQFLSIYIHYDRGVYGVFLGVYEEREMRAEMPIPSGERQFSPTSEQVLMLVDEAIKNWSEVV